MIAIMYPVQFVYYVKTHQVRDKMPIFKPLILIYERKKGTKFVVYSANPATNPTMARTPAALPLIRRAPLLGEVVVAGAPEEVEGLVVVGYAPPAEDVVAELLLAMAAA
jgi:hypothetical protein